SLPSPSRGEARSLTRRAALTLFSAAVAWPLAARAQQTAMPVIGFLRSTAASDSTFLVESFLQGLKQVGYVEGENLAVEYRWANGVHDRLPALAAELSQRGVAAIVAAGNEALIATKATTSTIPVVFALGDDPVRLGFVDRLNRPGGNITGVTFETTELAAKRVELLRELKPDIAMIGYLMNPNSVGSDVELKEVQRAAQALGKQVLTVKVVDEAELAGAFDHFAREGGGAVVVGS